jgi:hypothetical protein
MDKVLKNKEIVRQVLQNYLNIKTHWENIETVFLKDEENGHYQLMNMGWQNNRRVYGAFVHVNVKPDGKIWLQHDGTDIGIADELVEMGIPKEDIVLAFHAPYKRPYTGFAVA